MASQIALPQPEIIPPPKKKKKKFSDKFSAQPSAKMIWERKDRRYFFVQMPTDDAHLQMREDFAKEVPHAWDKDYVNFRSKPEDEPIHCKVWMVPASEESIKALYLFGRRHRFTFDSDIAVRAQASTEEGRELERMSYAKSNSIIELPKLAAKPYDFQKAGVAYMLRTKRCFVADEMGLGKTWEAIIATATAKAYPVLVVCPNTLKYNWQKEWFRICPRRKKTTMIANNRNIQTIAKSFKITHKDGTKEKKNWEVVIVNYDRMEKYLPYLKKIQWKALILDESHKVKNRNAHRTRACISLVDALNIEYVWLLTGTPIQAKPHQLIAQLAVMDRLADFGGRGNFIRRYCLKRNLDPTDVNTKRQDELTRKIHEALVELNKNLRSICYIRRDKAEVLSELPDKTRVNTLLTLDRKHRDIYDRIEADVVSFLSDRAAKDEKFLASIKKLSREQRELAIAERRASVEMRTARAEALVKIEHLKQAAATGKLEQAVEWIEDFLENDEKLVVFCTHKIIVNELLAKFPDALTIIGGQSVESRDQAIELFQKNPKKNLIICTIQAGGVGTTLTAASNTCFLELAWGPGDHDQAEDRCHRIGQKENVTAHYLLAKDTIDEKIAQLIEQKRLVVNAVTDGDPLHNMSQGTILGDLITAMTGKVSLLS